MLVLSRRPSEKILFPSVGISVEIIQTKGNTVRVGIEAPEDIRILRDELANKECELQHLSTCEEFSNRMDVNLLDKQEKLELFDRLEKLGLALALAQNQQQQGLSDHADRAIEQALARLDELRTILQPAENINEAVCETKSTYSTRRSTTRLIFDDQSNRRLYLEFELGS